MPLLQPDDPDTKRIDAAVAHWRQGDVALDVVGFVYLADGKYALTASSSAAAEEQGEGPLAVEAETDGVVVLTQTCDVVRSCLARPFVDVAPLVKVTAERLVEIERSLRPNYAAIPGLKEKLLVADLDRVMTVEKSLLASWTRTPGWTTDEEIRRFALALARKRARFAFPDDFNALAKKLQSRIVDKHDRQTDEGRALRALREIRVAASPSWDAPADVEIFFWFLRQDADVTFEGKSWASLLEGWKKLVQPKDRFTKIEGVVATLADMTAEEYVHSDPLDLEHLSG